MKKQLSLAILIVLPVLGMRPDPLARKDRPENQYVNDTFGKIKTGLKSDTLYLSFGKIVKVGVTCATVAGHIFIGDISEVKSVGVCWSPEKIPTCSDNLIFSQPGSDNFVYTLKNLKPNQVYLVRSFAVRDRDTVYSKTKAFYTHRQDAVRDIDSNYYNTVKIGSQIWLAEDIKTSRLNDGSRIVSLERDSAWGFTKKPAWCWYKNDSMNYSFPRGKLYNWHTVKTGKLCPAGWHVPSNAEWHLLGNYLGGDSIAGGKLKTTGTIFWRDPNIKASNETGFSAVPGGYRNSSGVFSYSTIFDTWWSMDTVQYEGADYWYVYHLTGYLYHEMSYKMFGYSVRCLKD